VGLKIDGLSSVASGVSRATGSGKAFRIRCGHDGYARLRANNKFVHWRRWLLSDDSLEINDKFTGESYDIRVFYHVYPGAAVSLSEKKLWLDDICIKFKTDAEVLLEDTFYYPEFGRSVPNKCLVLNPVKDKCTIKFIFQ